MGEGERDCGVGVDANNVYSSHFESFETCDEYRVSQRHWLALRRARTRRTAKGWDSEYIRAKAPRRMRTEQQFLETSSTVSKYFDHLITIHRCARIELDV